jgi:hypothetical protein
MMRLLMTTLGACLLFNAWTQDLKTDLDLIRRRYEKPNSFELKIAYKAFEDYQTTRVQDQTEAVYIKKGNLFYTKVYSVETLYSDQYVMAADHEEKLFMIDRRPKSAGPGEIEATGMESVIDELAAAVAQAGPVIARKEYSESPGGVATHSIWFNQGPYTRQEISFQKSSYLLKKITLYYREDQEMEEGGPLTKPRLEMEYLKFVESPALPADFFSESRFVAIVPNKRLTLNAKYADYKVINHLWEQDYRDYFSN